MSMRTIPFTRRHEQFGDFTDAVTVADDATPEQIEAAQDQRFVAWVEFLRNPPPPPPPDDEVTDG